MRYIVFIGALAYAFSGWTEPFDGRALRDQCKSAASGADRGFCSGYLLATADTLRTVTRYYKRTFFSVCLAEGETLEAPLLVQRFLDWTNRNPDKLHHSANEIAIAALHDGFACRRR